VIRGGRRGGLMDEQALLQQQQQQQAAGHPHVGLEEGAAERRPTRNAEQRPGGHRGLNETWPELNYTACSRARSSASGVASLSEY